MDKPRCRSGEMGPEGAATAASSCFSPVKGREPPCGPGTLRPDGEMSLKQSEPLFLRCDGARFLLSAFGHLQGGVGQGDPAGARGPGADPVPGEMGIRRRLVVSAHVHEILYPSGNKGEPIGVGPAFAALPLHRVFAL